MALLQKSEKSLTRMIKNYLNKKYFDFGFSWGNHGKNQR